MVDYLLFFWVVLIDFRFLSFLFNIVLVLGWGRLDKGDKCNEGYFLEF